MFNLHTSLVEIYDAIIALPTATVKEEDAVRPENLITPNEPDGDTSKKPYWAVSFLGTQAGRQTATNGDTFTFLVQVDCVVKTGRELKALNDFTALLWNCFPQGANFGGAIVSRRADVAELGVGAENSGYRRTMTIPFRVSTFSKAKKETSNG